MQINLKYAIKNRTDQNLVQISSKTEIDAKRGAAIHTLTPTPRRRSDPEFLKWDSEVNALLDDDYEGY